MPALTSMMILFLVILTGFILRKKEILGDAFRVDLATFTVKVALPLYLLSNMGMEKSPETLQDSLRLILMGILFYLGAILLSILLISFFKSSPYKKEALQFGMIFPNASYLAFPIIEKLLGSQWLFYGAMFNISFQFFLWTYGVRLFNRSLPFSFKRILNPSLLAVLVGYFLFITGLRLPTFILDFVALIGRTASPLAMIVLGMMLATFPLKELFKDKEVLLVSLYSLVILPLLFYFILFSLGFRGPLLLVPVIISGMPVSMNSVAIASVYKRDSLTMTKLVMLSTILSLVTITLMGILMGSS